MLDPAIRIHEYMSNLTLLRCLIGFCGTVNLSKLTHAWVLSEDQAVASAFTVAQRKNSAVAVDERCLTLAGQLRAHRSRFPEQRWDPPGSRQRQK